MPSLRRERKRYNWCGVNFTTLVGRILYSVIIRSLEAVKWAFERFSFIYYEFMQLQMNPLRYIFISVTNAHDVNVAVVNFNLSEK